MGVPEIAKGHFCLSRRRRHDVASEKCAACPMQSPQTHLKHHRTINFRPLAPSRRKMARGHTWHPGQVFTLATARANPSHLPTLDSRCRMTDRNDSIPMNGSPKGQRETEARWAAGDKQEELTGVGVTARTADAGKGGLSARPSLPTTGIGDEGPQPAERIPPLNPAKARFSLLPVPPAPAAAAIRGVRGRTAP